MLFFDWPNKIVKFEFFWLVEIFKTKTMISSHIKFENQSELSKRKTKGIDYCSVLTQNRCYSVFTFAIQSILILNWRLAIEKICIITKNYPGFPLSKKPSKCIIKELFKIKLKTIKFHNQKPIWNYSKKPSEISVEFNKENRFDVAKIMIHDKFLTSMDTLENNIVNMIFLYIFIANHLSNITDFSIFGSWD